MPTASEALAKRARPAVQPLECLESPVAQSSPRSYNQRRSAARSNLSLKICSNRFTLPRLLELLETLPRDRLTVLDVSHNDLGDSAPQALVRCLPALRELHLTGSGIGVDGVKGLLSDLRGSGAPTSPSAASPSRRSPNGMCSPASSLKGSSCSPVASPKVRGSLSKAATYEPSLQTLDLSACALDNAMPELGSFLAEPNCSLTSLDLSFCGYGPEAIQHLRQGLRANCTLTCLRLNHCHLREHAVDLLSSWSSDECQLPLRQLYMAKNNFSESAWQEFGRFLMSPIGQMLRIVDVSGNSLASEAASRSFGRGLLATSSETSLRRRHDEEMRLDLSGTRPYVGTNFDRWDVTSSHVLTALRATNCRVMDVKLDQCTSFTEAAMPTLARICLSVKVFSFSQHSLGEVFVHALAELARAVAAVPSKPGLAANAEGAANPTSREPGTPATVIASRQAFRNLRLCTREIYLNDAALHDHSIRLLGEALANLRSARQDGKDVEVLEVAGNHLSVEAIDSLEPILVQNACLRRLILSRNRLRQTGAVRLSELLPLRASYSASPLDFGLRHCHLTGEGVAQVWQAILNEGSRVAAVDFADNALGNESIAIMHGMTPHRPANHTTLRKVNLMPNPCTTAVVIQLLLQFAPWQAMTLDNASFGPLDAPDIVSALSSLGSNLVPDESGGVSSPSSRSRRGSADSLLGLTSLRQEPFKLSIAGASMMSKQWHWGMIADAMKAALAPDTRPWGGDAASRRMLRQEGVAWKRFGGCGDDLIIDFSRCELAKAAFTIPVNIPASISPTSDSKRASPNSSLARSARKEIRARVPTLASDSSASTSGQTLNTSLAACARGTGKSINKSVAASTCATLGALSTIGDQESAHSANGLISYFMEDQSVDSHRGQSEDYANTVCHSRASVGASMASQGSVRRTRSAGSFVTRGYASKLSRPVSVGPSLSCSSVALSSRDASPQRGNCLLTSLSGQQKPDAVGEQGALVAPVTPTRTESKPIIHSSCHSKPMIHSSSGSNMLGRTFERKRHLDLEVSTVLRELRGIESLRLEACGLDDRWLASLCHRGGSPKWSSVRSLDLTRNELTAACCSALSSVVTGGLEVLIIDGNRIMAQGFEALCMAIRPNSKCALRILSVADNGIGHPGGFVAADLLSRPTGSPLQNLCLARNPLSSGEMVAMFRALYRQAGPEPSPANSDTTKKGSAADLGRRAGRLLEVLDLASCGVDLLGGPLVPQLARVLAQSSVLTIDLRGCPLSIAGSLCMESGDVDTGRTPPELVQFVSEGRLFL